MLYRGLAALFALAWSSAGAFALPSIEAIQLKQAKINGSDIAYVDEGSGQTVVFTHGASGDWRTWHGVGALVAEKYRYVSYSRRYHIPNGWPDDGRGYSFEQHVEDLAAFIRSLNVGKVHLVGSSYGGALVGNVALRYPELLRSVVLGEPGLAAAIAPEAMADRAAYQKQTAEAAALAAAGNHRHAAILLFDAVVGSPGAFDKLSSGAQERWLSNSRTVPLMFADRTRKPVSCEQIGKLQVPALVIGGDSSRISQQAGNDALMKCLPPDTTRAVVPNATHVYWLTQPEATARAILQFIAKH
jgi:pimeloyl-ACP methyl ester carboxylesterase